MIDKDLGSKIGQKEDLIFEESDTPPTREKVYKLRKDLENRSKEKRDKHLDYKILKTKASSHFGAHVIGPIMGWYYKKFTGYTPKKYREIKDQGYNK